jgi:hypothetical protein
LDDGGFQSVTSGQCGTVFTSSNALGRALGITELTNTSDADVVLRRIEIQPDSGVKLTAAFILRPSPGYVDHGFGIGFEVPPVLSATDEEGSMDEIFVKWEQREDLEGAVIQPGESFTPIPVLMPEVEGQGVMEWYEVVFTSNGIQYHHRLEEGITFSCDDSDDE